MAAVGIARAAGRVRCLGVLVGVLVGALLVTASVGYGQGRPEPARSASGSGGLSPEAGEALEREERRRAAERRKRRATEQERARRRESRGRYRGLSRSEALAVGKRHLPEQLDRPGWKPLELVPGQEVVEYMGPFSARVSGGRGRPASVVESTLPLRVAGEDGRQAPVDLRIVSRDGALVPENPLVDVRAGGRAADPVALPDIAASVSLVGASETARGEASGASVFYAGALADSDLVIQPQPDGFESFVVLRSSSSPELTSYRFALPDGASLRKSEQEGFEVVRGNERLASVSTPRAWDADGAVVDTQAQVVGDELRVSVAHRDLDVKYPITVDPHISEDFRNWQTGQTSNFAGWSRWSPRDGRGVYFTNSNWFLGLGLYTFQRYGAEQPADNFKYYWDPAEWQFRSRGTTWVYAAQSYLRANDNTATCQYEGIYSPGDDGWPAQTQWHYSDTGVFVGAKYTDFLPTGSDAPWKDCNRWRQDLAVGSWKEDSRYFCLGYYSCESAPTRRSGNYYVLGTHVTPGTWYDFTTFMGGAAVHIADPEDPSIVNFAGPSGWTNDSTAAISFSGRDPGLGVRTIRTYAPNVAWSGAKGGEPLCDGRAINPCANERPLSTTVGDLPEGLNEVVAEAVDPAGRRGVDKGTVKVDRTGPVLGTPRGSLWDRRNQEQEHRQEGLYDAAYSVRLEASDGSTASNATHRSGTKAIDVRVRDAAGVVVQQSPDPEPQTCPLSNCTKTRDWTLYTDSLADGEYTIEVTATDQLNNPTRAATRWSVTIDRRGDIVSAVVYDEQVQSERAQRDEWAQVGTQNARTDDWQTIRTRDVEPCPANQAGCATRRVRLLREDSEQQYDDDVYTVTVGRSPNDRRLRSTSFLLAPANSDLGTATASGPIDAALVPGQKAPPASTRYALFERRTRVVTDEQEHDRLVRLWVAEDTRLPLKRTIEEGSSHETVVVSYGKSRAQRNELPADWFATPRPSGSSEQRQELPPEKQPEQRSGEIPRDEEIAMARDQRATYGMNTDLTHVAALHDDPATAGTADTYGFPVDAAERAEFAIRADLEALMPAVDAYGAQVPVAYAGVELEAASGNLVVRFTRDVDRHVAELRSQLGVGDRLEGRLVVHTLEHMRDIETRLANDVTADGRLFGEPVSFWEVDIKGNTIRLAAPNPSVQFRLAVATTYGPAVSVEVRGNPTPLRGSFQQGVDPVRGGQLVGRFPDRPDCTIAFPGQADRRRGNRTRRVDVVLTNQHCGPRGTSWYTENEDGFSESVGSTYSFVRGLDIAAVALDTGVFASRRGGIYLRTARNRDRYISLHGVVPQPPGRGARVCVAAGRLRFSGDNGEIYGRNICGTVEGYRTSKRGSSDTVVSDRYMGIRLDGDRCYPIGGSSGSPVYRREGRLNKGVAVIEGADTRGCSEQDKTAKIVTASTLADIFDRTSSYAPFFREPPS